MGQSTWKPVLEFGESRVYALDTKTGKAFWAYIDLSECCTCGIDVVGITSVQQTIITLNRPQKQVGSKNDSIPIFLLRCFEHLHKDDHKRRHSIEERGDLWQLEIRLD